MKALRAPILLPALAFLLLATPRLSASCVLREGQGADFGRIGVTTEESVGAVPRDVNMLYESGVLSQIFVYGGDCRTSKGIGIGDAQGEVERAYGRGKKSVHSLEKGKGDRIGQMGDYFLEYSGVTFVIAEEKVVAFIIVAGSDAASSSRMNWALGAGYGVVGLVLVVWAAPLSVRYNSDHKHA